METKILKCGLMSLEVIAWGYLYNAINDPASITFTGKDYLHFEKQSHRIQLFKIGSNLGHN